VSLNMSIVVTPQNCVPLKLNDLTVLIFLLKFKDVNLKCLLLGQFCLNFNHLSGFAVVNLSLRVY